MSGHLIEFFFDLELESLQPFFSSLNQIGTTGIAKIAAGQKKIFPDDLLGSDKPGGE